MFPNDNHEMNYDGSDGRRCSRCRNCHQLIQATNPGSKSKLFMIVCRICFPSTTQPNFKEDDAYVTAQDPWQRCKLGWSKRHENPITYHHRSAYAAIRTLKVESGADNSPHPKQPEQAATSAPEQSLLLTCSSHQQTSGMLCCQRAIPQARHLCTPV